MAVKNTVAVYLDGINRTYNTVLPIKWGNFLDERLDECRLSLRGIKKEIFQPLTPVEIVFKNTVYWGETEYTQTETAYYVVADDSADEMQIGSGLYNHDLYLIEVTKAAECVVSDTLTYTNDLGRSYTGNAAYAQPVWE